MKTEPIISRNNSGMHLLLLADLHFRSDWYRWLAGQNADLVAIAGDLLDGFHLVDCSHK